MDKELDFHTYLFFGLKKISIITTQNNPFKKVYEETLLNENSSLKLDYSLLDEFLEKNILKIEKKIGNFIKNISLIIDSEDFNPIQISVKGNNFGDLINLDNIIYLLNDAKEQCKKNFEGKKIIHMIIDSYLIDGKTYNYLPKEVKCSDVSLSIRFICLSDKIVKHIEMILKKYQILLNNIISANYALKLFDNKEQDFSLIAKEIINGYNQNEIQLVSKKPKNPGFFEKFFNLFN